MSEVQETPEVPEEKPETAAPPPTWQETLDAKLAQRDQMMAEMFNQTINAVVERLSPQNPQQQQPAMRQDPDDEVTDNDFANSPAAALRKFHDKKIRPIQERLAAQPQQDVNAGAGMMALIEVNKEKLKASMTPEEWDTYLPYFEKSLERANPRALINPDQMRMAYVIVKDHVDRSGVLQSDAEKKRITRNSSASLSPAGGRQAKPSVPKVDLDEDEKRVIAGMGISPEVYNQYSDPKMEFEVGGKANKGNA